MSTTTLRPAATLVLVRPAPTPSGHEVVWVHRARGLRFLGDFWVFPGGAVDAGEAAEEACAREAFEEAGLLLGAGRVDLAAARAAQAELVRGRARWTDVRARLGVPADAGLRACGAWRTPPFGPLRYEARFFLRVASPDEHDLHVVPGELDHAEWIDPALALARWASDEALLAPPTRRTLEALAATPGDPTSKGWLDAAAAAIARACPPDGEPRGFGVDFRPGVRVVPVRTPTLPPATHTNCYVVGLGRDLVVIDPASPHDEERAHLDAILEDLMARGHRLREVLLTHHHPDHVAGAEHLARRLGAPIAAHARTAERLLGRGVSVDRLVEDGEVIDLPANLPGARPRRLRAHLLEGHADGHLVFHEEVTNGVVAGDMVAGTGTIIVDPPEGDMALYLDSLRRLRGLAAGILYPAHGPPIGDPAGLIDEYVAHRLDRERKVLAAVEQGAAPVDVLVPRAYPDVQPVLYPFAARSLLAHLQKLAAEGRVVADGDVWRSLD